MKGYIPPHSSATDSSVSAVTLLKVGSLWQRLGIGSVVTVHGVSWPLACGLFLDQE